jgi:DNA-binding response OmpR family regulator
MRSRRKILIIDDDPVIREMLGSLLAKAGYEVSVADNGKSGLESAERDRPDLVITDGLLPKMHGFLVCKAIKEFDPPPKVIILTGLYTKPTYRWNVKRDYYADDLLGKPIEPSDLLACIQKHLADLTTMDTAYALPSELADDDTEVNGADAAKTEPESSGAKFSDAEMEEIFSDWSIPCF